MKPGMKKIIQRLNAIDGYGKKVIFRSLACGHRVPEPTGGTAKKAQHAFCEECSDKDIAQDTKRRLSELSAVDPRVPFHSSERALPTIENIPSVFAAAQVIYEALRPFKTEKQRDTIMNLVYEVLDEPLEYK